MNSWISVKNRLPPKASDVIVFDGELVREVDVATWTGKKWIWGDGSIADGITHWMALPEPPAD